MLLIRNLSRVLYLKDNAMGNMQLAGLNGLSMDRHPTDYLAVHLVASKYIIELTMRRRTKTA